MTTIERDKSRTDWMITAGGRQFFLLDPKPSEVHIDDIAHALAHQCRFAGHTTRFYSVAEHSVHASHLVPDEHALSALLHDASEAYVGDLIRPLKRMLPDYERIEGVVWEAIADRFGVPRDMDPSIKWADNVMLLAERRQIIHGNIWAWTEDNLGLEATAAAVGALPCYSPSEALMLFLSRYRQLAEMIGAEVDDG